MLGLLLLAGCGEVLDGPSSPVTAHETGLTGYMPFIWLDGTGMAMASEIIASDRRRVELRRARPGLTFDRLQALLPHEPFVSHPSAVTLANGHTLMHAIVQRNNRFAIAQIEDPFGEARSHVLPLAEGTSAVAPFAVRSGKALYLCWTRLEGNQARLQLTQSQDNGRTWSVSRDLARGQIGRMAVLPNGHLWLVYQTQPQDGGILEIHSLTLNPQTGAATPPRQITHLGNSHDPWPWIQGSTRHLAFAGSQGEPFQIYETVSPDGHRWSPPRALTHQPKLMHVQPHVLPLADGRILWSWGEGRYPDGPFRIHLGFGSNWGNP